MRKKIDNTKWKDILSEISKKVIDVSYRTWFEPLIPWEMDEDAKTMYFITANSLQLDVLKNRYIPVFEECIESVFQEKYKAIIKLKTEEEIKQIQNGKPKTMPAAAEEDEEEPFRDEFFLNPRYNFDNFIVGDNNRYAHAVSLAVAESPADAYNPLFLYGGSGLGKTHLMHAIGHYVLESSPEKRVLYVSSEMFTSELIRAIQNKKNKHSIQEFKNKYRNVDVLLIDDIQFIEGKDSTQIEFFHTFNELYDNKKQIVISSDRHPNKLTDLDDRLRSRFQWNVVADIQPPEFETRVAILRNITELEGITIDEDVMEVIDLIAEKIKFNVRELEGALTRVISYSKLFKEKIDVKFARKNLTDIFSERDFELSCETIKKTVCKKYNIKIADIESAKRKREFSHPRQIAMYLCRELTDTSLPKIGDAFGGRDHTTVLHAYEKISSELKTNPLVAEEVKRLKEDLK